MSAHLPCLSELSLETKTIEENKAYHAHPAVQYVKRLVAATVQAANATWVPPTTTMPMPTFLSSSKPIYVAIHARKHEWHLSLFAKKIVNIQPVYDNGEINVHFDVLDDTRFVEMIDSQLNTDDTRFYFQPEFRLGNVEDESVYTSVYFLSFSSEQIEDVQRSVRKLSEKEDLPQAHIVLVIVSDEEEHEGEYAGEYEGEYDNLSLHLFSPLAMETVPPRPNMMAMPLESFVVGAETKYLHPRG